MNDRQNRQRWAQGQQQRARESMRAEFAARDIVKAREDGYRDGLVAALALCDAKPTDFAFNVAARLRAILCLMGGEHD